MWKGRKVQKTDWQAGLDTLIQSLRRSSVPIPHEHVVPGCPGFLVDGFRYKRASIKHYFLSHYHSDHTVGLIRRFTPLGKICLSIYR